jgi:carbohydrate kinase (thermoresistant glucokinase family)
VNVLDGAAAVVEQDPALRHAPLRIVIMGVSGCGKTTLGQLLAASLGLPFIDADDLHPPRNVSLMAAGTPLTDDDRRDWLQACGAALQAAAGSGAVLACSALKRSYRDRLRDAVPSLALIHLHGSAEQLQERLTARRGHYMPPSLLHSQLATLEPPAADENALTLDVSGSPEQLADAARRHLQTKPT